MDKPDQISRQRPESSPNCSQQGRNVIYLAPNFVAINKDLSQPLFSSTSLGASRARERRRQESDDQRKERLEREKLAKRVRRAQLTEQERSEARRVNTLSHAVRRANLSVEAQCEARQTNAISHAVRRASLSTEEQLEARHANAISQAVHRANASEQERAYRQIQGARYQAIRRQRQARNNIPLLYKRALMPVRDGEPLEAISPNISECPSCKALKLKFESKGMCCAGGQIPIYKLYRPDESFVNLFRGNDPACKLFRKKIRWFNSCFSLSAFQCNQESRTVTRDGMTIFGVSYHTVPNLVPQGGHEPRYSQLYLYDSECQLDLRLRQTGSIEDTFQRDIFVELNRFLLDKHRLFATVKSAYEMVQDYPSYKIVLDETTHTSPARRQFSAVRVNELALLFPENAFREGKVPGIVLNHKQGGGSTTVDQYSSLYTAAGYPLIFFDGQPGWGRHSVRNDGRRLSLCAWTRFLLFVRTGEFNPILESCNLGKQFVLDSKQRIEWVLHQWYRSNQPKLRVDARSHVAEAQDRGAETSDTGKKIILTAAAKGSPRWFHQRYLNAMEIVAGFGAPSLFITVTCNQNWPEVAALSNLARYEGWSPSDRPDLVARVFHNRLQTILDDIVQQGIFGKVVAHCHSIEWQKRGNPHAHCLIWLSPEDLLDTVTKVDSAISATIPPESNTVLRELVIKHMIHGPCGERNPNSPCMELKNGARVCSKQYPKTFRDQTLIGEDCYAQYARPSRDSGGEVGRKGRFTLDNRDVVPYNPYLLQKYGCHINVEKVCSVKSLRYIFKYTFKGCDMATYKKVKTRRDDDGILDEIANWEEGCYLSVGEAVWDIFEFPRHANSPPIVQLDLHLPGENLVVLDENIDLDQVNTSRSTKLTAFFELNQVDEPSS